MMIDVERLRSAAEELEESGCQAEADAVQAVVDRLSWKPSEILAEFREVGRVLHLKGHPGLANLFEARLRDLELLLLAPKFTNKLPTVPGWYWVRDVIAQATGGHGEPKFLKLGHRPGEFLFMDGSPPTPGLEYSPILAPSGKPAVEEAEEPEAAQSQPPDDIPCSEIIIERKPTPRDAPVNHPDHYNNLGAACPQCGRPIECIEIARWFPFNLGSAIKYIWRCGLKDDAVQDLEKAAFHLTNEAEHRKAKVAKP